MLAHGGNATHKNKGADEKHIIMQSMQQDAIIKSGYQTLYVLIIQISFYNTAYK